MTPSRTAATLLVPVGAGGAVSRCPVPYIAERGPTDRRAGLHQVELNMEQVAVGIQGVQQRIDYAYGPTSSLLLITLVGARQFAREVFEQCGCRVLRCSAWLHLALVEGARHLYVQAREALGQACLHERLHHIIIGEDRRGAGLRDNIHIGRFKRSR